MKHVKLFEQHINESIQGGSYYFNKNAVNVPGVPARGEVKYAVIAHNMVDVEGTIMYLKLTINTTMASFEPKVLSIHDTEADAVNAYTEAVKGKGYTVSEMHQISFAYGKLEVKGSNLPFTEIDGIRATLTR
jgi:hypothetical protein